MAENQSGERGNQQFPATGDVRHGAEGRTTGLVREPSPSPHEVMREATAAARQPRTHDDESIAGRDDKRLSDMLPDLNDDELSRLAILQPGAALEQGAVYLDLNDQAAGPFKALGGHTAGPDNRYVAKRETDYELWNRIAGQDRGTATDPAIERPEREGHAVANQANLND